MLACAATVAALLMAVQPAEVRGPEADAAAAQAIKDDALAKLDAHPYRVPWWLRNPHLQSAFPPLLRRVPELPFEHARWDTPDEDFLDLYRIEGAAGTPQVLLLHGLGGNVHSNYIVGMAARFVDHGWGVTVLEMRASGNEINRAKRLFHAGETVDLDFVVRRLTALEPGRPLFVAGISLGGNILGKWLGEQGDAVPAEVQGAAIISPPFDPSISSPFFEQSLWGLYDRYFLRRLVPIALEKEQQYPGIFDVETLKNARTLRDFDDIVTAPLHGFRDVAHYYGTVGCVHFLGDARVHTLLIAAEDDPFTPPEAMPRELAEASPWLVPQWTRRGGHVGFVYGPHPFNIGYWDEDQVERFFLHLHANGNGHSPRVRTAAP